MGLPTTEFKNAVSRGGGMAQKVSYKAMAGSRKLDSFFGGEEEE